MCAPQAPLADGTDVTERLPDDVLSEVLLWLPMVELLLSSTRVSRRWHRLATSTRVTRAFAIEVRFARLAARLEHPRVLRGHGNSVWVSPSVLSNYHTHRTLC